MLKFSWTLIALIALTINGLAQGDVSRARWKSNEITIDGNDREWKQPLNFYDDKTGLLFAICNDSRFVYFAFKSRNDQNMIKLMSAGWSLELSSKEKNRKFNTTILFPAVKMEGIRQKNPGSQFEKKMPGNPFVNAYRLQLQTVTLKGFQSNQNELKIKDQSDFKIAVGADSLQSIVYEIAIPLKELMVENQIQLNELITLNVNVNAMERPAINRGQEGRGGEKSGRMMSEGENEMGGSMEGGGMRGGMGGGMRGGMGGGMRGGMGGGMRQGGYPDRTGLFEKASFKQKFTLNKGE